MAVVRKGKHGYVVARFDATGFISLNSATAAVAANNAGETVEAMQITEIAWSCQSGVNSWALARGANTVLGTLAGTGKWDLRDDGLIIDALGGEPEANVVCTLTGAGTLIIKLHKTRTTDTWE